MEKFKQKIRTRLVIGTTYCCIILLLIAFAKITGTANTATTFNMGFAVGIEFVVIFFMWKYFRALRSEDKLRKLYIEENDERKKHIDAQIGGAGIKICLLVLSFAMLVSGYFNKIVFFTLLAVVLFIAFIKAILEYYYNKKM